MQSTNPLAELGVIIISVALIAAATTLLVLGKIDFSGMTIILGLAVGLAGYHKALQAPSPTQQQALQDLLSQVLGMLPQPQAAQQPESVPVPIEKIDTAIVPAAPKQA